MALQAHTIASVALHIHAVNFMVAGAHDFGSMAMRGPVVGSMAMRSHGTRYMSACGHDFGFMLLHVNEQASRLSMSMISSVMYIRIQPVSSLLREFMTSAA